MEILPGKGVLLKILLEKNHVLSGSPVLKKLPTIKSHKTKTSVRKFA
jgi:hypothetical protein